MTCDDRDMSEPIALLPALRASTADLMLALDASLILASPGRSRTRRVSETRSVVDPNTGETITRNESRDGGI